MAARALTARLGVLVGSLLACLALAATFVYPQRIAEWFVLAVVLQAVLVATRSLAATIVLSALCAAPAVLLREYPDAVSIPGYTHPEASVLMPWPLLAGRRTSCLKENTVTPQPAPFPGEDSVRARSTSSRSPDDFLAHYHRRSNFESVMAMFKGKFEA